MAGFVPVPACLRLADRVFPRVRAESARRLLGAGWSQTRTAEALGVSQAMVSKYAARQDGEDDAMVLRLADDLVQELQDPVPADGPSPWCTVLTAVPDRPGGQEALQDLLAAEQRLRSKPPLRLVPQIGMNLVRALPGAGGPGEVLGYPARIVGAGDRVLPPAPPELGASDHLARCLLALQAIDPAVQALGSVRGGSDVRAAVDGPVLEMGPGDDRTAAFEAALEGRPAPFIHDPGAFGIEPCLYVAGRDAVETAARIHAIHTRL